MTRALLALTISLATALVGARSASAQGPAAHALEEAIAHYQAGRLDEALDGLSRVRESAVEEPAVLASAYLHLGIIHATMGDASLARRDFEVALAIDPELDAPSELGPGLRRHFDAVRAAAVQLSITLEIPEPATAGTPLTFTASTTHAPPHLVAALRAHAVPVQGAPWVARAEGRDTSFEVPASAWSGGGSLELTVEALTAHGGVLRREHRTLRASLPRIAAVPTELAPPIGRSVDEGGSVVEEAWFWILIGVLVLGGAAAAILIPTVGTEDAYDLGAPTVVRF